MKIIDINYDPNTNITKVSLADKYGKYTGIAKLHPEDKYNHIVGGSIAQQRAFIKKLSEDIKRNRIMLKAIKDLLKDIKNNNLDISPRIERRFKIAIRNYSQQILVLEKNIEELKEQLKADISLRERIIKNSKAKNM